MKGTAAATVPAVSALPPPAASGCPGRTVSSACAGPTSGVLSAGIPWYIGSAAPGSAAPAPGTATVHFSKPGPVLNDAEGRTLYLPEAVRPTGPAGGGACASAWPPLTSGTSRATPSATQVTCVGHPLHGFAGDTRAGDTNGEEAGASGATVVRGQRLRQQGRPRSIGD